MTDALCGPSNALQTFKRHTSNDRSLQQDRLTGPRTAVQGFRTQDPRAGSLDADFHAFENAAASPFQEGPLPSSSSSFAAGHNFNYNSVPPQLQPQAFRHQYNAPAASAAAGWASDFQHLSIADQPVPAQQFRNYAPMMKSTTNGGWHNEFMRQQIGSLSSVAQGKQAMSAFDQQKIENFVPPPGYLAGFANLSVMNGGTGMEVQQIPLMQQQQQQMQGPDQFAGADWSHAFEEAFQDAFEDAEQTELAGLATEQSMMQQREEILPMQEEAEQIRIGSDAIDYTEMKDRTADQEKQDASALARVAGELLHNVQHDSSEKFQNSQFLDLMRKIRDRQVEVRNNDFESTDGGTNESVGQIVQQSSQLTDSDIRNAPDPIQNQDTFAFPDMNAVHAPREADFVDYSFDSDQFPSQPRNQMSELHPGGKLYPGQSLPGSYAQMSGAVPAESASSGEDSSGPISAADFEASYDENRFLASRFQRTAA